MADSGPPPHGMVFPQKISSENEEYVVDLEDNMHHPDGYGLDDRGRCKRRKRCGQCGPCQVKENCMKCHFCVRKDVLKQTCIYRKCVYLRSKPKPYSRPHQSPQAGDHLSPSRESTQPSPAVKSPVGIVSPGPGLPYGEHGLPEPRPDNPFFPHQLPQPPQSQQLPTLQNNGYTSPVPGMDRNQQLPGAPNGPAGNMNMQVNMAPQIPNNTAASPLHKVSDQGASHGVPHSVNSPPAPIPGIPQITSCGNIPTIPTIPPVVPSISSHLPTMSTNSIPGIPPIPSLPNMPGMNERGIHQDFRSPDQLGLHPHHPHPHFPGVPPVHPHPHMPHREPNLFADHSRVPHMNFSNPNHMDSFPRGPTADSSCMYHPSLQYSMPGHLQPSGPTFLSGAAEMNPFRSNFLNSFPPGYSYPPDRYREGFGSLPFSRLGMPSSTGFPQYPPQGAGYGVGNTFSQQYSPYNSQHGCPKNGSCPPVSPNTDDVKVLQEGYKKSYKSTLKSEALCDFESGLGESASDETTMSGEWEEMSPLREQMRVWGNPSPKHLERSNSVSSVSSRSSLWEPWRSPFWLNSSRLDDVRSRACSSRVSSDFECEVISVDDHQMNALIRSDGGNSIEIEFDNRSMSGSEDSSARKSSDLLSPMSSVSRSSSRSIKRALTFSDRDKQDKNVKPSNPADMTDAGKKSVNNKPSFFKAPVSVIQDLGDEGVLHLELPGSKVSVETVELTEQLLSKSSNSEELRRYISKKMVPAGSEAGLEATRAALTVQ